MSIAKFIPSPMAAMISDLGSDTSEPTGYGLFSNGVGVLPVSEHYNALCDGSFASVLGLNHHKLVEEAMAELATGKQTLH